MTEITSVNNTCVRLVIKLSEKKFRRELGLYLAEGLTTVKSIRDLSSVHSLYFKKSLPEAERAFASGYECSIYIVEDRVFDKMSETVNPSGALAVIKHPDTSPKEATGKALILDRISDPGNMGTIIRTAAACGYSDIYLIGCADAFSGKAVRASMSGIFRVRLYETTYSELKKYLNGYEMTALDMDGVNIYSYVKPAKNIALIVGSEAQGVSNELKAMADTVLSLPMEGDIESLNAAVAAGITMYLLGGNK